MTRKTAIQFLPFLLCVLILGITVACSGGGSSTSGAGQNDANDTDDTDTGSLTSARPYDVTVPSSYAAGTPAPLVLVLHGYSSNAAQATAYFEIDAAAERHGFIGVHPNGTVDAQGNRYWNATDACCAFDENPADDVAYLTAVLDEVIEDYNIDADRVYVIGHSNGGFMAHRMACERASGIAAVVSLAGVSWNDSSRCLAAEPVSVLQIHGDMDETIYYSGGSNIGAPYPSAVDTAGDWADKNGCTGMLMDQPPNLDLDAGIAGEETRVQSVAGCPEGGAVEFWTILGGGHVPGFVDNWVDFVWGFLAAHPKP